MANELKRPSDVVAKVKEIEETVTEEVADLKATIAEQDKAIKGLTPAKPVFKQSDSSTRETRDELHAQRKVTVNIPITENDKDDVVVQINGYAFQIKRGADVPVPVSVAKVLEDAKIMTFAQVKRADGEGNELVAQETQRIPFSTKG